LNVRRLATLLLCACGGHVAHEPATKPEPLPPVTLRAPRGAVAGEKLAALRDLVAPADWVEEVPQLDGIWPKTAASELREAWVLSSSSVCREASWAAAIDAVPADHHVFRELRDRLGGDDREQHAKTELGNARLTLKQERFCLHHDCRPPLSPPLTTLTICVDGVDATSATPTLMKRSASLVPLAPLLAIEGVHEDIAEYQRAMRGDVIEITLVASPEGQARLEEWLVSHGQGERDPVSSRIESTDPKRSFISYPPDKPENLFEIFAR
jgi:hypothetical protein